MREHHAGPTTLSLTDGHGGHRGGEVQVKPSEVQCLGLAQFGAQQQRREKPRLAGGHDAQQPVHLVGRRAIRGVGGWPYSTDFDEGRLPMRSRPRWMVAVLALTLEFTRFPARGHGKWQTLNESVPCFIVRAQGNRA